MVALEGDLAHAKAASAHHPTPSTRHTANGLARPAPHFAAVLVHIVRNLAVDDEVLVALNAARLAVLVAERDDVGCDGLHLDLAEGCDLIELTAHRLGDAVGDGVGGAVDGDGARLLSAVDRDHLPRWGVQLRDLRGRRINLGTSVEAEAAPKAHGMVPTSTAGTHRDVVDIDIEAGDLEGGELVLIGGEVDDEGELVELRHRRVAIPSRTGAVGEV